LSAFSVRIGVGSPDGSRFEDIEAIVDSGSSYTWVPGSILERLEVPRTSRMEFETADRRIIVRDRGETRIRLDGKTLTRLVVFGDEDSKPLVGADTLQGFSVAVDPVGERLVPVRAFLLKVLGGNRV
jgi:predicted aspartyl protease